ncbi:glycosyltransferase family 2 protein [Flavobacteriaceae bacterium MHTCC 0001]
MPKQPLVSIIIPTYNRAHLIGETLDSIKAQTYSNWECIVVDDGSTDNTSNVINTYCIQDKRFHYHKRPVNIPKGANPCRNYGYFLSKGKYTNWFDSDDIMHENKLAVQVKSLENNNFNFSICKSIVFKASLKNKVGLRSEKIFSDTIFLDYLVQKIVWLTGEPLWKKQFLQELDYLFDENLQAAQEWEFHCRVLLKCNVYDVIDEPLVYLREHKDSITYSYEGKERMWNYFLARKKVYENNLEVLDKESKSYLQRYFIDNYKKIVRSKHIIDGLRFNYRFIFLNKRVSLNAKFFSIIAIFSFALFGKGNYLLSKVKF